MLELHGLQRFEVIHCNGILTVISFPSPSCLLGHWSSPVSVEGQMFLCTDEESRKRDWPDLQILLQGRLWNTKALQNFRYTQEVSEHALLTVRAGTPNGPDFICLYPFRHFENVSTVCKGCSGGRLGAGRWQPVYFLFLAVLPLCGHQLQKNA